jgi:hypothetical protein
VRTVVGAEEENANDVYRITEARAAGSRVDVLDQDGPVRGAVALPQRLAVRTVVGDEEENARDVRQP